MTWNSVPGYDIGRGKISKERKNFTTRRMRQKEILLQEEYDRKKFYYKKNTTENLR